jgi:uncharacterized small protein (DUF1192 family)
MVSGISAILVSIGKRALGDGIEAAALARAPINPNLGHWFRRRTPVALDPFADEQVRPRAQSHELGQDLSTLSIEEIDERVSLLEAEIARLREARSKKEASRDAASAFFRLGSA